MDEVITLESDDEETACREASASQRNGGGYATARRTTPGRESTVIASASAMIVGEKPLDLESLFTMAVQGHATSSINGPMVDGILAGRSSAGTHGNHSAVASVSRSNGNGAVVTNGVSHVVYPRPMQPVPPKRPSAAALPLFTQQQTTAKRMRVDGQGSNNSTLATTLAGAKAVLTPSSLTLNHGSGPIIQPTSVQQLQQAGILPRIASVGAMNSGMPHRNNHQPHADMNSPAALQTKMAQFANTYLECTDPKQNIVEDEFAGQFKCTYNGCNKRLRNNITFMHHLWAHTNRFRSSAVEEEDVTNLQLASSTTGRHESGAYEVKDDVTRLRTCPECLITQPSPNRMHLHFHRVHKRTPHFVSADLTVCSICESVLRSTPEVAAAHFQRHGHHDVPYGCKRCKYRSSSREALLRHFAEHHCGSSMVLCPFCLASFTVPSNDRQRNTVLMKAYVQHVWDHETYHQHACQQCATRVVRSDPVSTQQKMVAHHKAHSKNDPKWKYERKKLVSIHKPQSKMVCWSTELPHVCIECRHVIDGGVRMKSQQLERHFKELKKCSQPGCAYESACHTALEMHEMLAQCRGAVQNTRWPFGKSKRSQLHCNIGGAARRMSALSYQCSSCSFTTTSGDAMIAHLGTKEKCTGATARLLNSCVAVDAAIRSKPSDSTEFDESLEAFGLLRLTNNESRESSWEKQASPRKLKPIDEALNALLPLAKVSHVRDNKKLVKFLTADLLPPTDADADKPEILKMVASFKCLMDTEDVRGICKFLHDATDEEGEMEDG